jgi:sugar phosphate isomerase/epimerase
MTALNVFYCRSNNYDKKGEIAMSDLRHLVQVCTTFTMLREGLLDHFIRHGLNPEIGIDAEAIERYAPHDFEEVADTLHRQGLAVTLHAPFVDLSAGSTDPAIRAVTRRRFEQLMELVPLFRPRTVVAHAGYDWQRYEYFRKIWLDHSTRFWSEVADHLNRAGCRLMLENVYEHAPGEILELFERLRALDVGFCLDCGHLTAFGRAPLEEWLAVLGTFIGQLHLHDNGGKKDDHLAMGQGLIDFRPLFAYFKAQRRRPTVVTMEVHRPDDIWVSLECLERLWPWGD